MENIKVASVQFEARDNDKAYNLSVIRRMCALAGVYPAACSRAQSMSRKNI